MAQRRHEQRLSFEERVWEQKSQTLFEVVRASRSLLNVLSDPKNDAARKAIAAAYCDDQLEAVATAVEGLADSRVIDHLRQVQTKCRETSSNTSSLRQIENVRAQRKRAQTERDAPRVDELQSRENRLRDEYKAATTLQFETLCRSTEALIMASRDDLRGSDS